jgi:anthranilate/para-aminobenzoate synthase component I
MSPDGSSREASSAPDATDCTDVADCYSVNTITTSLTGAVDPIELFGRARGLDAWGILESGKDGRYVYVLGGELASCRVHAENRVEAHLAGRPMGPTSHGDVFSALSGFFGRFRHAPTVTGEDFVAGGVGYVSYDAVRTTERIPSTASEDFETPLACFRVPSWSVQIDLEEGVTRLRIHAILSKTEAPDGVNSASKLKELEAIAGQLPQYELRRDRPSAPRHTPDHSISASMTRREFEAAVNRAIEYIRAGDIFQVNLSVRFLHEYHADPRIPRGSAAALPPTSVHQSVALHDVREGWRPSHCGFVAGTLAQSAGSGVGNAAYCRYPQTWAERPGRCPIGCRVAGI